MNILASFKSSDNEGEVEYDVIPAVDTSESADEGQKKALNSISDIDAQIELNQRKIDEINADIDKLTNHSDGYDYMLAIGSGIMAGVIDILFVGELSIECANKWSSEKINNFVIKIAKSQGCEKNSLESAVKFLEDKFPIAADKALNEFGGGRQHHLRDFSHHPTLVGLFFSFLTQFTEKVYGTDVAGIFKAVDLNDSVLIGKNFPEKITFGIINWFFHLVSDIAGSSGSVHAGKVGTGLPGPIVSFLKEISALPIFHNMNDKGYKELSVRISKLFNGTLLGKKDASGKLIREFKFDLRTELGIAKEIGKQAIPVIINECIVRGFYFIRRLFVEIKTNKIKRIKDLDKINWENTLPFKNRTIVRMLTISTSTMMAIDVADAAIESAIKSGGTAPAFIANMVLRVNFVGVGRCAVAIGTDVGMGINRNKGLGERMQLYAKQIALTNAKLFYKQGNMWIAAENTGQTLGRVYETAEKATVYYLESLEEIKGNLQKASEYIPQIEEKNPGLLDDINDILTWG